jgi:hypothetical protein
MKAEAPLTYIGRVERVRVRAYPQAFGAYAQQLEAARLEDHLTKGRGDGEPSKVEGIHRFLAFWSV